MGLSRAVLPVAAVAALVTASPAAADRVETMKGYDAPGPAQYDKVRVLQIGKAKAKKVLVLVPGTSAGGAYFRPVARDIVKRLPGWQVWAVERRENLLEDHSVLDRAKARTVTVRQLFDYYLNWIGNDAVGARFQPKTTEETAFAREWGMEVAVQDLRRVVKAARKGGRRVALGGHSLGGTITTAYATWDFGGKPGAKDLAGLVFIDGASRAATAPTPEEAQASLAALDAGSPFLDLTGAGLPWSAGVFNAVGSTSVLLDPNGPSLLQAWRFLPENLKPPVPATNLASYGYALDVKTGPAGLALVQSHIGHLADAGEPRGWVDDGLTTAKRAAQTFSGIRGMDGTAWYHPRRLTIDGGAVNAGMATPAQATLGLRTTHGRDLRLPLYAYETSLGKGRVLVNTQALAAQSGISASKVTLVDRSETNAHIDPIDDLPERNDFLKTVVPFLKKL
jgi:pimeloyl-ACP methyl ester carboxylesterase